MSKGIDFTVDIQIDTNKLLGRFEERTKRAQIFLDNQVATDSFDYVPFDLGTLAGSPKTASPPGEGQVLYDTPYARKLYYGEAMDFAKDKHPKATAKWLEASKAVHLKDWVAGVTKILEGRNLG